MLLKHTFVVKLMYLSVIKGSSVDGITFSVLILDYDFFLMIYQYIYRNGAGILNVVIGENLLSLYELL